MFPIVDSHINYLYFWIGGKDVNGNDNLEWFGKFVVFIVLGDNGTIGIYFLLFLSMKVYNLVPSFLFIVYRTGDCDAQQEKGLICAQ